MAVDGLISIAALRSPAVSSRFHRIWPLKRLLYPCVLPVVGNYLPLPSSPKCPAENPFFRSAVYLVSAAPV